MNTIHTKPYKPSPDEAFMNEKQKHYFKQKLLTWRSELADELNKTIEELQKNTTKMADTIDRANNHSNHLIEFREKNRKKKLITKIDSALKRIENNTYGYCLKTGDPIALERLEARPTATLCIEAQKEHEQNEKIFST